MLYFFIGIVALNIIDKIEIYVLKKNFNKKKNKIKILYNIDSKKKKNVVAIKHFQSSNFLSIFISQASLVLLTGLINSQKFLAILDTKRNVSHLLKKIKCTKKIVAKQKKKSYKIYHWFLVFNFWFRTFSLSFSFVKEVKA